MDKKPTPASITSGAPALTTAEPVLTTTPPAATTAAQGTTTTPTTTANKGASSVKHQRIALAAATTQAPPPSHDATFECKQGDNVHKKGCLDEIADEFKSNLGTIGGFALALLFIQLFGIGTGCYFSTELRKRYGNIA
jgi:hypothetical protein